MDSNDLLTIFSLTFFTAEAQGRRGIQNTGFIIFILNFLPLSRRDAKNSKYWGLKFFNLNLTLRLRDLAVKNNGI